MTSIDAVWPGSLGFPLTDKYPFLLLVTYLQFIALAIIESKMTIEAFPMTLGMSLWNPGALVTVRSSLFLCSQTRFLLMLAIAESRSIHVPESLQSHRTKLLLKNIVLDFPAI